MAGKRDAHGWSVEVEVAGGSTFFDRAGRSTPQRSWNAFNVHPMLRPISELLDGGAVNLTDTYPGWSAVPGPHRRAASPQGQRHANQNARTWGIDDAREAAARTRSTTTLFDAICEVIGEEDLPEFGPGGRWAILVALRFEPLGGYRDASEPG